MKAKVFVTLKPSVFDPQGQTIADALRRARRKERKAEQRLLEAWRRADELRGLLETADY